MFNDMTYCVIVWPNVPYNKLSFCYLIVDWLRPCGMEPMYGDVEITYLTYLLIA